MTKKDISKVPEAQPGTGRSFRVGKSFTAAGKPIRRGSVIGEMPWKNFNALVRTGYLIPIYAKPAAAKNPDIKEAGGGISDGA